MITIEFEGGVWIETTNEDGTTERTQLEPDVVLRLLEKSIVDALYEYLDENEPS
jgi:hypothetical protein